MDGRTTGAGFGARVLLLGAAMYLLTQPPTGPTATASPASPQPIVLECVRSDISPALLSLTPLPLPADARYGPREIPLLTSPRTTVPAAPPAAIDTSKTSGAQTPLSVQTPQVLRPVARQGSSVRETVVPGVNFEGTDNVNNVLPPDVNGDVGPNHYIETVNLSFQIFDKAGNSLYGPAANNILWSGFGGLCQSNNNGNPIVLYDEQADRWFISQFAYDLPDDFHQCAAVSATPNPTGAWYRYDFLVSSTKLNDYAKIGVWPDGYYLAFNQFDGASFTPAGQGVAVLEREAMLSGEPGSRIIYFDLLGANPDLFRMLPSDLDGNPPAAGTPNYYAQMDDDSLGSTSDQLQIWAFHTDWDTPANSTFTSVASLATAPFDSNLCNYSRNCIPQPDTAEKLDSLSNRLMYRLQYRNFGAYQTLVTNHTVDIDGTDHAGIRWYELRNSGSGWLINQQGTYAGDAPDNNHRWSGSIAMDAAGNMALGYSVSGPETYPSIRCVGRMAADPLGNLLSGERVLMEGHGSQTHSSHRWGGYSSMSVDPTTDDFWYAQEYYSATSSLDWQTRIASFHLKGSACPRQLAEGFEAGVMPPDRWTRMQTNASQTWKIMSVGSPRNGAHAADVEYDSALQVQDELLLTPELRMTSGILNFYSMGSLYWCRDDHDNCDLQLWLVVGGWDAGVGDDIYLGEADTDWTANWAWSLSSLDLTPFLTGKPVRIAFRYLGLDGAQVGLDDVQVCYQGADAMPWLLLLLGN